ncbi:MAG: hypothetical protein LRY53_07050 [Burkholderiaceae bacterium]|nr:hypothetical protein [Burkholderiaceae bacterium]MCD8517872.1 hypothetical protein [Burkholderiaceae bacterium]MCD8538302.1 hypothetical protein [Burkholderiaceae bacterium]MCD8565386.1 hypothetical protein [Burkholderiaceae bacterium]
MQSSIQQMTVGLSGSKYDSMVMHLAMRLAQKASASIDAYLIRPVPDDPQLLMASGFLGETFQHFVAQAEKTIAEFDRTARASFDMADHDFPTVTARYHNPLKDLAREFATAVWATDLAIMAHPALVNLHYYKTAVLDAIADSARPVLLLPEDKRIGDFKHALMVWRADTQHARALSSALPMLSLAETVTVLSVTDEDYLSPGSDVALQYLQSHGIDAQDVTLPGDERLTPKLINAICDERDVSLLVIGGGLQSDLIDSFVTGIGRRAAKKPSRPILAIG